jgi:hypothetical protein
MTEPTAKDRFVARLNQIAALGCGSLVALGWGLEALAAWRRPPGQFSEPYGWVIGLMMLPFAVTFQIASIGWRQRAHWRWIAQAAPVAVWALLMKACF